MTTRGPHLECTRLEPERYELREAPVYHFSPDRREFVCILGVGLILSVSGCVGPFRRGRSVAERLHIGTDGVVTVMTGKVDVGQGSRTQLTQAAAEELGVPVEQVRMLMCDTDLCPDDGGTYGSLTTPRTVPAVRRAAAAARHTILDVVASHQGKDRAALVIRDGHVVDTASGASTPFASLAELPGLNASLERPAGRDSAVAVRKVAEWRVLGTWVPTVQGHDIVTGTKQYPSDVVRPNMLYGKILRPASLGARLTQVDLTPAEQMPGVVVVKDGDFVGCAASRSSQATAAVDAISRTATWASHEIPRSPDIFRYLRTHAEREREPWQGRRGASSRTPTRAEYEVAYIQHAPMEPRAAVAEWDEGRVTVWIGSQVPFGVRREVADVFRIAERNVRVIVPDTGGAFGGKHTGEVAVEAARLAKTAGRPVSVRWTREEEFTWAYFRPAGVIDIVASVGDGGRIDAWDFTTYNAGTSAIRTPYAVPNARAQFIPCHSPLRQGSYRGLAATANNFARESFMDELAAEIGQGPLEFRLVNLDERDLNGARLAAVLRRAATTARWAEKRQRSETPYGIGIACGYAKGSVVATCAEVEVAPVDGRITVQKLYQVFECGAIQNPVNLRAQVEGGLLMGLGGALHEEIQIEEGRIANGRFSQYRVPRMSDVPAVETILLDRPDLDSAGAGETPIIAVAPAIANAVFHATGARIRSMPVRLA